MASLSSSGGDSGASRSAFVSKTIGLYVSLADRKYDMSFMAFLLVMEAILCRAIIELISYTEIDWEAYMQEVDAYLQGERDYAQIRGATGPLVYPAGFLYLYGHLFRRIAGGDGTHVRKAQIAFGYLYVIHAAFVLPLYNITMRTILLANTTDNHAQQHTSSPSSSQTRRIKRANIVWTWRLAMALTCLSKRIHSIFLLRLFNDAPAMLLLYLSILFFLKAYWKMGCFFFSLAVSIKMNILLFAPGLLLLLLQSSQDYTELITSLSICAIVQLMLGAPFLLTYPVSYIRRAFEFDRVFFFEWTVNWKFLPEDIFVSKQLSLVLLFMHLLALAVFAVKWIKATTKQTGAKLFLLNPTTTNSSSSIMKKQLTPEYVIQTMFVSNFVGICFARTLHYQFYSWYFHQIPFMLWLTSFYPMWVRMGLIMTIECAFNVYPATKWSSALLQLAHFTILGSLVVSSVPTVLLRRRTTHATK